MKIVTIALFVVTGLVVLGCAGSIQISPADRARISSVTIDSNVSIPEEVWYSGPEASLGALGALIGKASKMEDKIKALAKANNIHIDQIITGEFEGQISRDQLFILADSENDKSDAVLSFSISQYGLAVRNGFSSELLPMLRFTATLTDNNGTIVWEQTKGFSDRSIQGVTIDQIKSDPEQLRHVWTIAAKALTSDMLTTLK